jgi:hypothetical protein
MAQVIQLYRRELELQEIMATERAAIMAESGLIPWKDAIPLFTWLNDQGEVI